MALAVVRDLRERRTEPPTPEELRELETDVMAGFVLARASAGLSDHTIRNDVTNLDQVRTWFGRPVWEMLASDADRYFGEVMRMAAPGTRLGRSQTMVTYFEYLELRHQVELYDLLGRPVECPLDEINKPRGHTRTSLRIPPTAAELDVLFAGWREGLATCRKFAPTARNFATAKLMSLVGLRVNELRSLDLGDVKWQLGRFGKLHVRYGKGARGSGPRERMVPLINGADRLLTWFIEDVWGLFDHDHTRPGAPLFPSERRNADGTACRVGVEALRTGLATQAATHLPSWADKLTPHVLRHFCASELYLNGVDLLSIQELLGHSWVATTMNYVHVHRTRIEEAVLAGQARVAQRLEGLLS